MLDNLNSFLGCLLWTFQNEFIVYLQQQFPAQFLQLLIIGYFDHRGNHYINCPALYR
jgi:hypothetical protein